MAACTFPLRQAGRQAGKQAGIADTDKDTHRYRQSQTDADGHRQTQTDKTVLDRVPKNC